MPASRLYVEMSKEDPPRQSSDTVNAQWLRKWVVGEAAAWYGPPEKDSWVFDILNGLLRGPSQVCFMNNPLAGIASLAAIMVPSSSAYCLYVAVALAAECLCAAILGKGASSSRSAIRTGLFGYDGVLVGAACATFLDTASHGRNMIIVLLASAGAAIIKSALGAAWAPHGLPTFTMGFNLATLLLLMAIQGTWRATPAAGPPGPHLFVLMPGVGVGSGTSSNSTTSLQPAPSLWPGVDCLPSSGFSSSAGTATSDCASVVIRAWFRGVAQVYFCPAWGSGLVLALAFALCSPVAAVMAVASSAIGFCTGLLFGAPPSELLEGLWGYNGVIAGIAISVFYRWEWRTAAAAAGCVVLCTLLQGALRTAFAPFAMPVLTLPFCTGAIVWLLAGWPIRVPLAEASIPEAHALPRFGCGRCGESSDAPTATNGGSAPAESSTVVAQTRALHAQPRELAPHDAGVSSHALAVRLAHGDEATAAPADGGAAAAAAIAGVRLELAPIRNPAAASTSASASPFPASSSSTPVIRAASSSALSGLSSTAHSRGHAGLADTGSGAVAEARLLNGSASPSPAAEP